MIRFDLSFEWFSKSIDWSTWCRSFTIIIIVIILNNIFILFSLTNKFIFKNILYTWWIIFSISYLFQ